MLRFLLAACLLGASPAQRVVREQPSVPIGGVTETWRLVWFGEPRESKSCGPAQAELALTCPCDGVAYAQDGDVVLERERPGAAPERMRLAPLFAGSDMLHGDKGAVAMLRRWPAWTRGIDGGSPAAIRAQHALPILRPRDYDHDGIAGEFLLQIDTQSCGKHVMLAIVVTRDRPHLHVLTSAEHPEEPLTLYQWQWEALARHASPGRIADWACGDHGADEETTMVLSAADGRLHATRVTSICPDTVDARGEPRHDARFRRGVLKRAIL